MNRVTVQHLWLFAILGVVGCARSKPALAPPEGLSSGAESGQMAVDLKWKSRCKSRDTCLVAVERRRGSGFQLAALVPEDTLTFHDGPLRPATRYTYRLRFVTGDQVSGASNEVTADVPPLPPLLTGGTPNPSAKACPSQKDVLSSIRASSPDDPIDNLNASERVSNFVAVNRQSEGGNSNWLIEVFGPWGGCYKKLGEVEGQRVEAVPDPRSEEAVMILTFAHMSAVQRSLTLSAVVDGRLKGVGAGESCGRWPDIDDPEKGLKGVQQGLKADAARHDGREPMTLWALGLGGCRVDIANTADALPQG